MLKFTEEQLETIREFHFLMTEHFDSFIPYLMKNKKSGKLSVGLCVQHPSEEDPETHNLYCLGILFTNDEMESWEFTEEEEVILERPRSQWWKFWR